MSLTTRCPACNTRFRVVTDQLKVSDGWVRCGRCGDVFDGTTHLREAGVPGAPAQWVPNGTGTERPDLERQSEPTEILLPATLGQAEHEQPSFALQLQSAMLQEGAETEAGAASFLSTPGPPPLVYKGRRMTQMLLCAALGASLIFQFLMHERAAISARVPALQPLMDAVCQAIQCALSLPSDVDALVVDGSTFVKTGEGYYRLTFTLKNSGHLVVAPPSIELTLTDAMQRILARRVLSPVELGLTEPRFMPGGEWQGSVAVSVELPAESDIFTDYRIVAFYPR